MLTKLLMRIWLGPLPPWIDRWRENVERLKPYGFHFRLFTDYEMIRRRCAEVLNIEILPYEEVAGTRKSAASGPVYGELFAEECKGFDFWGHCDQDTVFGRPDRFVSDEFLADCDIFGNDPNTINGAFSLYRNCETVNRLFRKVPNWRWALSTRQQVAFEEGMFASTVREAAGAGLIRFKSAYWQAHDNQIGHMPKPRLELKPDGTLLDLAAGAETMMFHFPRTKRWPLEP